MSNERSRCGGKIQQSSTTYDGAFDCNSPRPPIPGEEKQQAMSDWVHQAQGIAPHDWARLKAASPTPRKLFGKSASPEPVAFGYDRPSSRHDHRVNENPSPPACLRWAHSLHSLLQDSDGVNLFQAYLESEGAQHADALDFWFACEGLRKQQAKEKIQQLVKVIYKKFFVKSALPINDELRREIGRNIKSSQCLDTPVTLFDEAQAQVESLINKTTYPNFLKSEMYLQYLESAQNISSSGSSSEFSSNELTSYANGPELLPTLHEDMELVVNQPAHINHTSGTCSTSTGYQTPNMSVRLTRDLLLMSQQHRAVDVRPKSEAYANLYTYRGNVHAAYNSYNPVSRQDSEMQSVSSHSDARTESDNMSLTDSSIDGRSLGRSSRRQAVIDKRNARESAAINRETHMQQVLIPRTQRLDTTQCQPMNPNVFAEILIEKLENLKREQDSQELLERKLKESESMSSIDKLRMGDLQSRELANAIREKLNMEDDNDQDILDQHVSRVFSDLTPARSPGVISPRTHSPPRNRHVTPAYMRPRRKDKDGFSTFSSDSGNVHDFAEGSEHKLAMVKSKSMPEYAEERFLRGSACRRSSSKKALTDLTDSGVSVVSDTPPVLNMPVKDNRVLAWLLESDKGGRGTSHTHSEMSLKHKSHRTSSATSPSSSRHRKGFGSRSSSLERNSVGGNLVPAQPFMADPNMPLLPSPNTAVQMEEVRRRLEDETRNKSRQRSSNRYYSDLSQSNQSTLRKSTRAPRPSLPIATTSEEVTIVVFSFCDEQFPYRTKIPGTQITLRQFKEYLPKKGNYRFFFKTVCEELDNQVIHEEVSNDGDVLPLWEGKIMAQVKPFD